MKYYYISKQIVKFKAADDNVHQLLLFFVEDVIMMSL